MLLMIDNYDSFTYNLVQYFGELGQEVRVFRNDAISVAEIARLKPAWLVISPGPCAPVQAGVSLAAIREFAGKIPLFGVCLGHQAIGEAFGGRVVHARKLMHGKVSPVHHDQHGVFRGLPSPLTCTRYHSLAVERESLPDCLEITAWTEDGEIMGLRHRTLAVEGVQFHPESILSESGHDLLKNFLEEHAK
ncbi:aminodeoxychorismate/anthranilate synthase component II, partial [Accumulibacter sp.]|jgi:anthranilate synthase component 2|uniref:anthranilate synthase component II n=1 Tax=Accumulibacter sp. TaxID=2053492 RepID=UPI002C05D707